MFRKMLGALMLASATLVGIANAAHAQTIKVLVMQNDEDPHSLGRDNRIQRAILNTWQQTLHAPAFTEHFKKFGIQGMDVYDESIFLDVFVDDPTKRRNKAQLIRTAELASNPTIDVLILYTVYAKAIKDPYTHVTKLVMSLDYHAIDVKSKRFFGGDNIDTDRDGIPLIGCAAHLNGQAPDEHCIKELVSTYGEQLARDAGNAMAIRLGGLIAQQYAHAGGYSEDAGKPAGEEYSVEGGADSALGGDIVGAVTPDTRHCPNIPTTFLVTFEGFSQKHITFLETNLGQWKCALDLDAVSQSFGNATYEYKTKANAGQAMRSIRLILEQIGVVASISAQSQNEVLVRAIGLRNN